MPTNMAEQVWRTGSIFSCCKGLWDVFLPTPITTKHQSVFWLVSQSRRTSAICVGSCRWISLAAATADPVYAHDWVFAICNTFEIMATAMVILHSLNICIPQSTVKQNYSIIELSKIVDFARL